MCISKCDAPYGAFPKQAYWLTNCSGYYECKHTPGLWRHLTRPISFTLVVNDFGVKYVGREHVNHLIKRIKEKYELTEDWSGNLTAGSNCVGTTMHAPSTFQCREISKSSFKSTSPPTIWTMIPQKWSQLKWRL